MQDAEHRHEQEIGPEGGGEDAEADGDAGRHHGVVEEGESIDAFPVGDEAEHHSRDAVCEAKEGCERDGVFYSIFASSLQYFYSLCR